jgi:CHAT domain-containing protein
MNSDIRVKILFLAADPSDESRLRLFQELRDIKARLQVAKSDKYQLEQQESVRVGDITQAIFDIQPQIIHFSGHGKSTGELCFENEVGKVQPVKPDALAAMFKLFSLQVNCVVLNACYSEVQAKVIAEHIPFVIGMNDAIGDKAAIAFAVGFYKALVANRSIEDAYQFGCVEIQLIGLPEHLKPVLYIKEHYKPEVGRKKEERSPFITGIPITDPRYFFGRN